MVLPKVYIETSVVSYLTAFPSRDIVVAAHQQITHAWWAVSDGFDRFVSEAVLTEAAAGDPEAAARRMAAISTLPVLKNLDLHELRLSATLRCGQRLHLD